MKKYFVAVLLLLAVRAEAQTVENDLVGLGMAPEVAAYLAGIIPAGAALDNNVFLKSDNQAGSSTISLLKADATDDTVLNADSGDVIKFAVASTPIAQFGASGFSTDLPFATGGVQPQYPAAAVITPSTSVPTPSAGNTLTERRTILAAGAPTAAYVVLPVATASVGKTYTVYNQGSNPLAIVPQTGAINVSAALTPFSCTTLKECQCTGLTTGVFGCSQQ